MARLVEARIRGLRTLADVTLPLGGLTVLIGDNGSGKSSILEALRIAQLATHSGFIEALSRQHMLASALRHDDLIIVVRFEREADSLVYILSLDPVNRTINHEAIQTLPPGVSLRAADPDNDPKTLILRNAEQMYAKEGTPPQGVSPKLSIFEYFSRSPDIEEVGIVRRALEGIDTHLPFEVSASWATRAAGRSSAIREPRVIEPSHRLELFGANLANVYQTLKNSGSERWRETLELLQLGLGPQLQDVLLAAIPGGGHLGLSLELRGIGNVPAFQLADGQLTYLAFVALVQLDPGRTLLSFDEPEQHLHPALLGRVVQLFESASAKYPVVLATHSDRLLDFLPDPAASVLICELDSDNRTVLRRLDPEQLDTWLSRYRGLGEIRAAGQLRSVTRSDEDSAA